MDKYREVTILNFIKRNMEHQIGFSKSIDHWKQYTQEERDSDHNVPSFVWSFRHWEYDVVISGNRVEIIIDPTGSRSPYKKRKTRSSK